MTYETTGKSSLLNGTKRSGKSPSNRQIENLLSLVSEPLLCGVQESTKTPKCETDGYIFRPTRTSTAKQPGKFGESPAWTSQRPRVSAER
ncbi:hypothetical protein RUM44_006707 [Polyplax serrata]|uniref:Uncharacterized protein n=1 Tax=Polyplax serrata TaxID=468196 RepID=A0ABR1AIW7_POLSC